MTDEAARTIGATLARIGLAETDLGSVGATLARRHTGAARSLGPLPRLDLTTAAGELVSRGEIGRGGMGVVYVAEQRSLEREVAVKRALGSDPDVARALVREARVMGALEHPSLVPIHALGAAADGTPLLVMKRVEGVPWRTLLRDPEHPAWAALLAGHGDRLRANVDVLIQLCRALAFAHERGVVHRDLKPENVMIGRFGEVVLLDWGVALRLSERDDEPLGIVGTPGYLAPEMARADPKLVDPRTDVYLLGATLYEVLSGRMPHEAPTALAALASALTGEIAPLPSDAPEELATLAMRALALDSHARIVSAEAFREGLAHYLASRDTDALVAHGRAAITRARAAMASEGASSASALRALTEARFGLASAIRARPRDRAIRRALDEAITVMIERELALGSTASARGLVDELSSADPELSARIVAVEEGLERERAEKDAAAQSRREADSRSAVRPLTLTLTVVNVIGTSVGTWFALDAMRSDATFPTRVAIGLDVVGILIGAFGMWIGRRALLATAGARRVTALYTVWGWSIVLSDLVTYSLGGSVAEAGTHSMLASAMVSCAAAVTELPELWLSVIVHALAVALIFAAPNSSALFVIPALVVDLVVFIRAFRKHAGRTAVTAS